MQDGVYVGGKPGQQVVARVALTLRADGSMNIEANCPSRDVFLKLMAEGLIVGAGLIARQEAEREAKPQLLGVPVGLEVPRA